MNGMRPFEAIRVIDVTHVLAGPFCTYQLALLGAEVIKVEHPRFPDVARGRGPVPADNAAGLGLNYQVQGGNKRSLMLDLSSPDGRAVFGRLVADADVLVENYRVGALAALGLGQEALAALNPGLIHCSITGFGQDGAWVGRNAYDNVVQAMSGIMNGTGAKTAAAIIDYATGMNAAFAISAALYQRDRTGVGQAIDVAMVDTAVMMMGPEVAAAHIPAATRVPMPREAGIGSYSTRDGLLMLGAFNGRQNRRLWRLLGREDFAAAQDWPAMWAASGAMRQALAEILLSRTAAEWEDVFNAAGIPATRVRTLEEAIALPAIADRGYLRPVPGGDAIVPTAPFRFATNGPTLDTAPPAPGADTDAILTELGMDGDDIARLRRQGVVA
jgi:crotonobetainyl-CoA:carnitine CoA-transferase CaiB-like acyl-CoA transferase